MLLGTVTAFAATLLLIRLFSPIARRIGLVDEPGGRKRHERSVPLIGGVAVICGFVFGLMLLNVSLSGHRPLFAAMLLVLIVGVLDDFHELSARARFAAHIAAAGLLAFWGEVQLLDFGRLLGFHVPLAPAAGVVTIFCVVGVINALNLVDGIDGLAASVTLVALLALGFLARGADPTFLGLIVTFAAAVFAFWLVNARLRALQPAPVFLGDSGSGAIGLVLAYFFIAGSQGTDRVLAPVTALWIFALPLLDTVYVMVRRILRGVSPFSSGRDHFHHLFLRSGFSVRQTLMLNLSAAVMLAGFGIVTELAGVPEVARFALFLALATGYYLTLGRAWDEMRWLGREVSET